MKRPFPTPVPLSVVMLVIGCSRDLPAGLDELAPNFAVAGSSGCFTVSGEIAQTGVFPSFSGTISGAIEGTVSTQLNPGHVAGSVSFGSAVQTWQVTGGTVPELVGRTVRLTLETRIVFAQPPLARNNTTARLISGAESGDLTYHGTLNVSPPPPFEAHVEYHGVICP